MSVFAKLSNRPEELQLRQFNHLLKIANRESISIPFSVEAEIENVDVFGRLRHFGNHEKFYWQSPDGEMELAGTGRGFETSLKEAHNIIKLSPQENLLFLCQSSFNDSENNDSHWADFPQKYCVIPSTMFKRIENKYFISVCLPIFPDSSDEVFTNAITRLRETEAPDSSPEKERPLPDYLSRISYPDSDTWKGMVSNGLEAIESGDLDKIVLARRIDYAFGDKIDPIELMEALRKLHFNSYALFYQNTKGGAYLSVTPEKLYSRNGDEIVIDALSSTVDRGKNKSEDDRLAQSLFDDRKLQLEHQTVLDGIINRIHLLCGDSIRIGESKVLRLKSIQHLLAPVSGKLREKISDFNIVSVLHPTPAIAGMPKTKAVECISSLEPFNRGWYASPVGYISQDRTEIAVGIRSMIVKDNNISVFVGAGIVKGSDPESEWGETESKDVLRPLTRHKGVTI